MRLLIVSLALLSMLAVGKTFWDMNRRIDALESELSLVSARYVDIEAPVEQAHKEIFNLYVQLADLRQSVQNVDPASLAPVVAERRAVAQPNDVMARQQRPAVYVDQSVADLELSYSMPVRADGSTNLERHRQIQQSTGSFAPFRTDED